MAQIGVRLLKHEGMSKCNYIKGIKNLLPEGRFAGGIDEL